MECSTFGGHAELRCVRDPKRAVLLDAGGNSILEASTNSDTAMFDVSPGDLVQLRVEFE